jgi:hypothetical protein
LEINEENIEIRKRLLNLPKVTANENFLNSLQNKIKKLELEEELVSAKKAPAEGFLNKLFGSERKPWLVPAFGLAAVVIIVFSVVLISNKDNTPLKNDKVTTMSQDVPPSQPNSSNTPETLKKNELPGKEITEDIASLDQTSGKYTDQGSKTRLKTGTTKISDKEVDLKTSLPTSTVNQEVMDSRKESVKIKANDEEKSDSKVAEAEKKEGNDRLAKSEKSKKDDKKDDNDLKGVVKSLQGSTEIDKTVLQNLKDKIEKGTKKKE